MIGDDVLIECKTKMAPSKQITLKKEWFTTLREEQISHRKSLMAVLFDFGDGTNYVAIPEKDFKEFLRLRSEEEEE